VEEIKISRTVSVVLYKLFHCTIVPKYEYIAVVCDFYSILLLGRPLRRPRHRWEDKIRKDLWDLGCEDGNWVEQAQDRLL
jgi:hypothetical protein